MSKKNHLGYSLLEAVMVILLSAYVLQAVFGFFYQVYSETWRFQEEIIYDEKARSVSQFIGEQIKSAEQIEIIVQTLEGDAVITPNESLEAGEIIGNLKAIKMYSTKGIQGVIKLTANRDERKGKYSLVYVADSSGTQNLICDEIEAVKVKCANLEGYIKFECKVGSINSKNKAQINWVQCLRYKEGMNQI